jgi:hypothetical protein
VRAQARPEKVSFRDALEQVESALHGGARREILEAAFGAGDFAAQLAHLRKAMRSHAFPVASRTISLRRMIDTLDARSRREGMHVLQGWDFVAHEFPKDIAPVLLIDYCARLGIPPDRERSAMAILLDQYFLAVLSLLTVRAWDEGDANDNLDRITRALGELQGTAGSGHRFVADAETLLMLAVSYYHPDEQGYDLLVRRVSSLDASHQLRFARSCAAILSGHLRWGLRFMYQRDVGRMREDNVADYPLLMFAVLMLAREYDRLSAVAEADARDAPVVEALLCGLSSDPWAFAAGAPPSAALSQHASWHDEFRTLFERHRDALLAHFEAHQPSPRKFSPLAFSCNFPTNATVAMAALAVQTGAAHPTVNALFAGDSSGSDESALRLAQRLTEFAASDPGRLGAGGAPLLLYDPFHGVHCYNTTIRTLSARG